MPEGFDSTPLFRSFQHYLDNQESFVEAYNGQVIVLVDCKLVGVYGSVPEAYHESLKEHAPGTFLTQKVSPGNSDTTASTFLAKQNNVKA